MNKGRSPDFHANSTLNASEDNAPMTFTPSTNTQGSPSSLPIGKGEQLDCIIQTLKAILPELRDLYGVISLGLFGSYVRGEQTPDSDLDLLVEFDPVVRFGLLTYCELENTLSDRLGIKVDLVMKKALKPRIGERILQEVVYL
jgi:predicted nucleotidyltransferase